MQHFPQGDRSPLLSFFTNRLTRSVLLACGTFAGMTTSLWAQSLSAKGLDVKNLGTSGLDPMSPVLTNALN